jgi:hypothetical protein
MPESMNDRAINKLRNQLAQDPEHQNMSPDAVEAHPEIG